MGCRVQRGEPRGNEDTLVSGALSDLADLRVKSRVLFVGCRDVGGGVEVGRSDARVEEGHARCCCSESAEEKCLGRRNGRVGLDFQNNSLNG
jgi:hypothetical protein